jgi:hypothetical protein
LSNTTFLASSAAAVALLWTWALASRPSSIVFFFSGFLAGAAYGVRYIGEIVDDEPIDGEGLSAFEVSSEGV